MHERQVSISAKLIEAVRRERERGTRQYTIARRAHMHPSTVSTLINSMTPIRAGDRRVIRLGAVVGLPADECFEEHAPESFGELVSA